MLINKIKSILSNKAIKNSFWIISEQIFQMIISLVVGVLSARYLGPSNYGTLNYTASFISFFTSVATLGLDGVVIMKIIAQPEKEGELLGTSIIFRIISAFLSSLLILFLIYIINGNNTILLVLAAVQSLQLIMMSFNIFDTYFQRHLKSKYVSIAKMVSCILVAAYRIYLLATKKSIIWFAFSNTFNYLIIAVILSISYKRDKGKKLTVNFKTGFSVLSESYHFILSGLMVAIYGQMDKIMLGSMLSETTVGFYTAAATICTMWIFVPTAIINSFRPVIMELKTKGEEKEYLRRLQQLYSAIIWLCLFVSLVVFLLGNFIVKLLYGSDFIESANILKLLIWSETFSMIGTARGIWIISEKKNKYTKYYLAIGCVVNLILNFLLIPNYGAGGAAFATLITQITTSLIAPLFFKGTMVHTKIVLEAFICKWYFIKGEDKNGDKIGIEKE